MGSTKGPVLPQVALIASATAVGYAPELLPFELWESVVIVSERLRTQMYGRLQLLHLLRVCMVPVLQCTIISYHTTELYMIDAILLVSSCA